MGGKWKFVSYTENGKNAFYNIIKATSGWTKANAAYYGSFGVGTTYCDITQNGDEVDATTKTILGSSRSQYVIGQGQFETTDPAGSKMVITPIWETDDVLLITTTLGKLGTKNAKEGPSLRRTVVNHKETKVVLSLGDDEVTQTWAKE